MSKLFEYAILYHPKAMRDTNGNESQGPDTLLVKPTFMLAKSDKEVAMRAARDIPEAHLDELDRVEVLVRPF